MVLTFKQPRIIDFRREQLPRVLTWALLIVMAGLFAYNYFDNPLPGPYGACYTGRGGTKPCGAPVSNPVRVDARTLPIARP